MFGPYGSPRFGTPWGDAFDFDHPEVRQYVVDNVRFWLDEYHFDGLRLDAVHYMFDDQAEHILTEIQREFSHYAGQVDRELHLIGETNIYDPDFATAFGCGARFWSDLVGLFDAVHL